VADVGQWLDSLGLGQYVEAFEENAIAWATLPELDHELRKEVGVKPVGHRVAILKAIQSLDSDGGIEIAKQFGKAHANSPENLLGQLRRDFARGASAKGAPERSDDHQVDHAYRHAKREGKGIGAAEIEQQAAEIPAEAHADIAEEIDDPQRPPGEVRRNIFADDDGVGRHDAAIPDSEHQGEDIESHHAVELREPEHRHRLGT